MPQPPKTTIERRRFLAGALGAGPAIGLAGAPPAIAAAAESAPAQRSSIPAQPPREADPPKGPVQTVAYPGSDFMIDVIKTLNFEYVKIGRAHV